MIKTVLVLLFSVFVAACGGGSGDDAKIRFANFTTDSNGLSLYTGSDEKISNINQEQVSGYVNVDAKTYDLIVKKGTGSTLTTASTSLAKKKHYTAVSWGRDGAMKFSSLGEDEDAPNSGKVKLRVLNAATDAGSVDVYITNEADLLENNSPNHSAVAVGSTTGFGDFNRGTYRLRVTAAGDKNDVRLDVSGISFTDKQVATLVLQSGIGGTLVNGYLMNQQSDLKPYKTTQVRVRLAAGVGGNGNVSAKVGTTNVSSSTISPSVSSYVLAPSGNQTLLVQLGTANIFSATQNFVAGGDYTVLASGPATSAQAKLLLDDNRLPSNTSKAKIRLVHGADGFQSLSLSVDTVSVVSDLAYGSASSFVNVSPNTGNALIEVTSPLSNDPVYTTSKNNSSTTGVTLDQQNVYSVFVLGGNSTARGTLRRER
jgi:Domain of unknown function (DUF4397)